MSQSTQRNLVNFDHRVTGHEDNEREMTDITPKELSESIGNMTDRATAQLSLLLPYYDCMSQQHPDDRTMYFAINSIILELTDVQKTVEAYALANKPNKQA